MRRASSIIRELVFEAANLDRGLVAVELELLIRNDLGVSPGPSASLYSDQLTQFARQCGFNVVGDASVKRVDKAIHREKLYQNCEFNNIKPGRWSQILQGVKRGDRSPGGLVGLLTWLKRSDRVPVRGGVIVTQKSSGLQRPKLSWDGPDANVKLYDLPRARLPVNSSAGVHIHFDVKSWFDDDKHAKRFLQLWNAIRQGLPKHLPTSRYGTPGTRGHRYASLDATTLPTDYEVAMWKKDWMSGGAAAEQYFGLVPQRHRYWALNTQAVLTRGDIEFRFIHATLNINTIESWVRALAELIEFARRPYPSLLPADLRAGFVKYVDTDAKDTADFLRKSAQRYAKSKDPELLLRDEPSKVDRKMFAKTKPVSRTKLARAARPRSELEPVQI